jgi:hypothetical protein
MKFFFFSLLLLVSCRSVKKSQEHTQLFQQRDSVEAYHEYRGESLLREWHWQEIAMEVVPADSLVPAASSSPLPLSPERVPSLSLSPLPVPSLQGVVISQQKTAQGQTLSIQGAKVLKLHFREKTLQEQLKEHEQRTTEKQTHQTHIRDTHKQTFDLRRHPYFSLFLWGVAMLLLFLLHPRKQK